jgi:hypothetical protein
MGMKLVHLLKSLLTCEVAELDVFLTHKLEDDLVVLQHPLRPPWRPDDTGLLQAIRYKPNAQVSQL